MLTRFQKAGAIVCLAYRFAAGIGGEIWQASPTLQPPSQSRPAEQAPKVSGNSAEKQHEAAEEALAEYTKWLMFFTAALAAATIGLGAASYIQLRLANSEFVSTHRPEIRIKHLWLGNDDIWGGEQIMVFLGIVNTGTVDATLNQIGIRFVVAAMDRPIPFDPYFDPVPYLAVTGSRLLTGVWMKIPNIRNGTRLTSQQIADIQLGRSHLYCLGCVGYLDPSNKMRITGFCRVLTFPQNGWANIADCRFRKNSDPDYEYED